MFRLERYYNQEHLTLNKDTISIKQMIPNKNHIKV